MSDKDRDETTSLNVRRVLDEIGAEEAVAQFDARLEGFEQEFSRLEQRQLEASRARQGELDVMRARIDDALDAVRESLTEQRDAWSAMETRLAGVAGEASKDATSQVASLRDEVAPKVERAMLQTEEIEARLQGELVALSEELSSREDGLKKAAAETRSALEATIAQLRTQIKKATEEQRAQFTSLDDRIDTRIGQVDEENAKKTAEVAQRVDGLRRELDASAGELRAGLNLRAKELEDVVADVHTELAQSIDDQSSAAAELERRWIEGTREIARRIEELGSKAQDAINSERAERSELVHSAVSRADEVASSLAELEGRVSTASTRRMTEVEQLRRTQDEITSKVGTLTDRVAEVTGDVVADLGNRVASVKGEVEAVRETTVRQEQRLAAIDHLTRRVGELSQRQQEVASEVAKATSDEAHRELLEQVGLLRDELKAAAERQVAESARAEALTQQIANLEAASRENRSLRTEVRELTARTSEISTQVAETDKLARAAGQAIANAVRRARAADKRVSPPAETPVPPVPPGAATVPAAERNPLFQDRPSALQRDEHGQPVVGVDYYEEARREGSLTASSPDVFDPDPIQEEFDRLQRAAEVATPPVTERPPPPTNPQSN